jgi:uncharacterized protein YjbJ (UPF0337 family)
LDPRNYNIIQEEQMNNSDQAQTEWTDLKGKIKSKWAKFSDTEVDAFRDKIDMISEQLQKTYGYTKDKAEQEYKAFKTGLGASVTPISASKPN